MGLVVATVALPYPVERDRQQRGATADRQQAPEGGQRLSGQGFGHALPAAVLQAAQDALGLVPMGERGHGQDECLAHHHAGVG